MSSTIWVQKVHFLGSPAQPNKSWLWPDMPHTIGISTFNTQFPYNSSTVDRFTTVDCYSLWYNKHTIEYFMLPLSPTTLCQLASYSTTNIALCAIVRSQEKLASSVIPAQTLHFVFSLLTFVGQWGSNNYSIWTVKWVGYQFRLVKLPENIYIF